MIIYEIIVLSTLIIIYFTLSLQETNHKKIGLLFIWLIIEICFLIEMGIGSFRYSWEHSPDFTWILLLFTYLLAIFAIKEIVDYIKAHRNKK